MRLFHSVLGAIGGRGHTALGERLEALLEAERAQLPPWLVVGFGTGIAAWFALGRPSDWAAFICLAAGLGVGGFVARAGAERTGARLVRAVPRRSVARWSGRGPNGSRRRGSSGQSIAALEARIERVEPMVAKGTVRLTLAPGDPALPPRVRVSVDQDKAPEGLVSGATCGCAPG